MARARVRVKLDRPGIAEIMTSSQLEAVLKDVADDVASAAGGGYEVVVDRDRRKSRSISMVLSDDFGREAATGALSRAVGSMKTPWKK